VGGAILPLIMGKLSDIFNLTIGLLIPLAAMVYILYLAFVIPRTMVKTPVT
jgi:fucose permease